MYQTATRQFEGPLELLVDLIDKKKLSISEISLAEIADQYLDYLKKLENFPTKEVSYFLIVASTLVLVKSRSLMPSLEISEEEKEEIDDLEKRLKIYQKFQNISEGLEKIFGNNIIFSRETLPKMPTKTSNIVFVIPRDLSVFNMNKALSDLLNIFCFQKTILPEKIIERTITLEQKIEDLTRRLQEKMSLCFSEINKKQKQSRMDIIVSFLALLELTKRKAIRTNQNEIFGEIHITQT
ncbi:segregation/condensation protein A [Patescibacteria group bacterium]|nr:segregation/condensation protein A [Patescibacteria group bacterium]MBU2632959.1 segregation/condensation protein A [Patescibacteria group bacterium]